MQGKEIGELKTELASLQADLAEITKASVDLAAQLANRKGYDFGHITTAFKRVFEGHRIAEIDGTITIHKTPSELLQDLLKELPNV
jgi:sorbitol-specific phosphotransferase system component IIA